MTMTIKQLLRNVFAHHDNLEIVIGDGSSFYSLSGYSYAISASGELVLVIEKGLRVAVPRDDEKEPFGSPSNTQLSTRQT